MYSEKELRKRLFVSNFDKWADLANKNFLSENKLNVRELENGLILPAKDFGDGFWRGGGI